MRKVKLYIIDSSMFSLDDLSLIPLTPEEKQFVEKASRVEKKKERILSKYLKDKYIGNYYLDEHKKPLSKDKYFNISHTSTMIILGICDINIGVDIEHIKTISPQIKRYSTSLDEFEYISNEEKFFEIWTNKEALMKCKGIGISNKVSEIPGLPINGIRVLDNEEYISKTIKLNDYIITICIKSNELFEIEQVVITNL